jgi:hypothetical protein
MGNNIRGFHRFDKAWYAGTDNIRNPEIDIGIFDDDGGGCVAEFNVEWIELDGELVPQLQIFSDAWKMLSGMKDLFDELAKFDRQDISIDKFCEILLSLEFRDLTEYDTPEKYQRESQSQRVNI